MKISSNNNLLWCSMSNHVFRLLNFHSSLDLRHNSAFSSRANEDIFDGSRNRLKRWKREDYDFFLLRLQYFLVRKQINIQFSISLSVQCIIKFSCWLLGAFCIFVDLSLSSLNINLVLNEVEWKKSLKGHPECIITHWVKESKYNYRSVFDFHAMSTQLIDC